MSLEDLFRCPKCGETKPIIDFFIRKNGRHSWCKNCYRVGAKKWYDNNLLQAKESRKKWRTENAEHKSVTDLKWQKENKERVNEKNTKWRNNHLEQMQEIRKKWNISHPEQIRQKERNRKAKIRGGGGKITAKEWITVLDKFGNKCLCCGKTDVKITLDHVIPIKLGGSNSIENAQPLCQSCNSKKGAKTIDYRNKKVII